MPDLHSLPAGSRPEKAIRNNGSDNLVLERYKLRELAEGWPCYRYSLYLPRSLPPLLTLQPETLVSGITCVLYSTPQLISTQPGPAAPTSKISSPLPKQGWIKEHSLCTDVTGPQPISRRMG